MTACSYHAPLFVHGCSRCSPAAACEGFTVGDLVARLGRLPPTLPVWIDEAGPGPVLAVVRYTDRDGVAKVALSSMGARGAPAFE